ncbi:MAG: SGNH/GDSL hydrolase family protein [Lentisphaeraceae bacterium]|nr:SGNH/GDSL hydrolase family protein [Lentisphaeraceae bacterium]
MTNIIKHFILSLLLFTLLGSIHAETSIKENFDSTPTFISNWEKQWTLQNGSLSTTNSIEGYSYFDIGNLEAEQLKITFKAKLLKVNDKGGIFGVKLMGSSGKIIQLFYQAQSLNLVHTNRSKKITKTRLGKLSKPLLSSEKSEWTQFSFVITKKSITTSVDKQTLGTVELHESWSLAPQIHALRFHSFQADVSFDDIHIESNQKNIMKKVQPGDKRLSQLDVIEDVNIAKGKNDYRILFIGDSITRHGFSKKTIRLMGWGHTAGMAATKEENDYAHLLTAKIQKTMPTKIVHPYFHNKGGSGAIMHRLSVIDSFESYEPHLVVVQLGEHEKEHNGVSLLKKNYIDLLQSIQKWSSKPLIICTGVWSISKPPAYTNWSRKVEDSMKSTCDELSIPFASVEKYALDPTCSGWGTHSGVKWHPNDKGMLGYATEIFKQFQKIK